jgi:hypothetical protein
MKPRTIPVRQRERGSGLVELIFTIPVLLIIAGATVDLSRYMRYQQITTFISQETASQIYKQCSDITIYNRPTTNSAALQINQNTTSVAVQQCMTRIQAHSQAVLNQALGSSAVASNVFRWNITDTRSLRNGNNCGTGGEAPMAPVTVISAKGSMDSSSTCTQGTYPCVGQITNPRRTTPPLPDTATKTALETSTVTKGANGIVQTYPVGASSDSRVLVSPQDLCQRGRVVAVEVGYAFQPIVKFLPAMMLQLNTNATQREVTIF